MTPRHALVPASLRTACLIWFAAATATAVSAGLVRAASGPAAPEGPLVLWYERPATKWVEALPIGNGRLGAMVHGGLADEDIQFNDDTLWTGRPHEYQHPGAAGYLSAIRKLLAEGRQAEAEALALKEFMSVPLRQKAYQPFGNLRLHFPGHDRAEDYRRSLDLDAATACVRYRVGHARFERLALASHPDQAIIVRLSTDTPGALDFTAQLDSPHPDARCARANDGRLALRGRVEADGLRFEARLHVEAERGKVTHEAGAVRVEGADSALLVLAGATSFRTYQDIGADPAARCDEVLRKAAGRPFASLLQRHTEDHRRLFRRVALDLGATDAARLPTDRRLKQAARADDPALGALYFQFGRYLLIASSRPGDQAANLQGVWNDKLKPSWDSKWTTNINTEMNYWPAEPANLAECHEPLFDLIDEVAATGRRTAQVHYDCRGWVLHHNTDLWRGTAPINNSNHGIWVTGGAWLCQHLWEHYQFTGDRAFLEHRAYPRMRDAALFFVDFLVKDPKTGWLISTPSNSPEHGGLVAGPTMDHQIIRALFASTAEAAGILGVDRELAATLDRMRGEIAPNLVGRRGQLQEWLEDRDDPNDQHRHVSHLWGLYPGSEINPRRTPALLAAARQSLVERGDGGTGWSKAWKINFWARLLEGDHAHKMLIEALAGNTYPNLFDAHPPFQIDGNFGGTAGIIEMLVQSQLGEVSLLPALPRAWPSGHATGLCARGGLELDIAWRDGRATTALLRARDSGTRRLRPPPGQHVARVQDDGADIRTRTLPDGALEWNAQAGHTYALTFRTAPG